MYECIGKHNASWMYLISGSCTSLCFIISLFLSTIQIYMKYCDGTSMFENKENDNIVITTVYAVTHLKITSSTTVTIALMVGITSACKWSKLHDLFHFRNDDTYRQRPLSIITYYCTIYGF